MHLLCRSQERKVYQTLQKRVLRSCIPAPQQSGNLSVPEMYLAMYQAHWTLFVCDAPSSPAAPCSCRDQPPMHTRLCRTAHCPCSAADLRQMRLREGRTPGRGVACVLSRALGRRFQLQMSQVWTLRIRSAGGLFWTISKVWK